MAQITAKVISELQSGVSKTFVLNNRKEVDSARAILSRWKDCNPGKDYKTHVEKTNGLFVFHITVNG